MTANPDWQTSCVPLASFVEANPDTSFDYTKAKEVTVIIVKNSVVPQISNPITGSIDLDEIC